MKHNLEDSIYIKPSQYAKLVNLHVKTVVKKFHEGLILGYQDKKTGTIYLNNPLINNDLDDREKNRVILYARVSSTTNKPSLDGQIERMRNYAYAKGYIIIDEIKEIASGLNDERPKLLNLFKRNDYDILLCEHKDRLTRFGFNYISNLLKRVNIKTEIINLTENKDNELVEDFVAIVTSFCQRIYGRNRKKKTAKIIEEIVNDKK